MRIVYQQGRVYNVSSEQLDKLVKAGLVPGRRGQVLDGLRRGLKPTQIATKLNISVAEVLKHSRAILKAGLL